MAQHAAWALGQAGGRPVVLVCGGWHVGGIRAALTKADGTLLYFHELSESTHFAFVRFVPPAGSIRRPWTR